MRFPSTGVARFLAPGPFCSRITSHVQFASVPGARGPGTEAVLHVNVARGPMTKGPG